MLDQSKVMSVLGDVARERGRQYRKWGEQNHDLTVWMTVLGEEFGEACQAVLKLRGEGQTKTFLDVRYELVQVAAVAVAAIEFIDRHYGP